MTLSLAYLRRSLRACTDCAERQLGLRYVREAQALGGRNPEREAELMGQLPRLLAYAEERTRRAGREIRR
ncbi:MAG TPA: hypothetical protein PKN52_00080 [Trueperaceae bacterium]|nr:hypothetical protein [Trueperaceae bacterium]